MSRAARGIDGDNGPALRALVLSATGSAATSRLLALVAVRLQDELRAAVERTNHSGTTVTLLEGPAWVLGAVGGRALAGPSRGARHTARHSAGHAARHSPGHTARHSPGRSAGRTAPARPGSASTPGPSGFIVATVGSAAFGALDDIVGTTASKGLRGHLAALQRGEVTTGAVKILGLATTGVLAAALVDGQRRGPGQGGHGTAGRVSTLVGGAVIAAAANVVNLFDLRPGRALKVVIGAGVVATALTGIGPHAPSRSAAAAVGASLGVLDDDLAARSMLGDTGANAAGAAIGLALVERLGLTGRLVVLAGLTGLTLASERVSFSAVIDSRPVLRRIDAWGRGTPAREPAPGA